MRSNDPKKPRLFDQKLVLDQLKTSCTIAYAEYMRSGFPVHISLELFLAVFKQLEGEFKNMIGAMGIAKSDFVKKCLLSLGLTCQDFKIGTQYIFLRSNKTAAVDHLISSDAQVVRSCLAKTKRFLILSKWKQYKTANSFIRFCQKCK